MLSNNMWWGYLHSNGTIQVKRWFGDHKDYTDDCYNNDFVSLILSPFKANTRKDAVKHIEKVLRGCGYTFEDTV
jgi:hypothetical protein